MYYICSDKVVFCHTKVYTIIQEYLFHIIVYYNQDKTKYEKVI